MPIHSKYLNRFARRDVDLSTPTIGNQLAANQVRSLTTQHYQQASDICHLSTNKQHIFPSNTCAAYENPYFQPDSSELVAMPSAKVMTTKQQFDDLAARISGLQRKQIDLATADQSDLSCSSAANLTNNSRVFATNNELPIYQPGDLVAVDIVGHDFTGLGINISPISNARGLTISQVLKNGPAAASKKINPGDKLVALSVSFESMSLNDAVDILTCASPYPLRLFLEKGSYNSSFQQQQQQQSPKTVAKSTSSYVQRMAQIVSSAHEPSQRHHSSPVRKTESSKTCDLLSQRLADEPLGSAKSRLRFRSASSPFTAIADCPLSIKHSPVVTGAFPLHIEDSNSEVCQQSMRSTISSSSSSSSSFATLTVDKTRNQRDKLAHSAITKNSFKFSTTGAGNSSLRQFTASSSSPISRTLGQPDLSKLANNCDYSTHSLDREDDVASVNIEDVRGSLKQSLVSSLSAPASHGIASNSRKHETSSAARRAANVKTQPKQSQQLSDDDGTKTKIRLVEQQNKQQYSSKKYG